MPVKWVTAFNTVLVIYDAHDCGPVNFITCFIATTETMNPYLFIFSLIRRMENAVGLASGRFTCTFHL